MYDTECNSNVWIHFGRKIYSNHIVATEKLIKTKGDETDNFPSEKVYTRVIEEKIEQNDKIFNNLFDKYIFSEEELKENYNKNYIELINLRKNRLKERKNGFKVSFESKYNSDYTKVPHDIVYKGIDIEKIKDKIKNIEKYKEFRVNNYMVDFWNRLYEIKGIFEILQEAKQKYIQKQILKKVKEINETEINNMINNTCVDVNKRFKFNHIRNTLLSYLLSSDNIHNIIDNIFCVLENKKIKVKKEDIDSLENNGDKLLIDVYLLKKLRIILNEKLHKKLESCINSVLQNYKSIDINKEMNYQSGEHIYQMTTWDYIWIFYQTIENFNDPKIRVLTMNETVYAKALGQNYINTLCTGLIEIFDNRFMSTKSQGYFDYRHNDLKFNIFLEQFNQRITEKDCNFTSLAINYRDRDISHRNMLLIYRDIDGSISVSLYEPHGHYEEWNYSKFYKNIENFVSYLLIKYNEKYNIPIEMKDKIEGCNIEAVQSLCKYIERQERLGLQSKIKEPSEQGYCVMYSYFWLYLVLKCYKNTGLDYEYISKNVEKYLIDNYEPVTLANIIISFTKNIISFYIQNLSVNIPSISRDYFFQKLDESFKKRLIQNKIFKRIKNIREKSYRKTHGDHCEKDEDCGSGNCTKGRCGESK